MGDYDFKQVMDDLYEGVYIVDPERRITYWNEGARRITGFSEEEIIGRFCHDDILNHIDSQGRMLCLEGCPLHGTLNEGEVREIEAYIQHKRGHRIPVKIRSTSLYEKGQFIGTLEIFIENIDSNHLINKIDVLSKTIVKDPLTGLPNRRRFEHYLNGKLLDYEMLNIPFGIVIADIDNFEAINLTYGTSLSDDLLVLLSESFLYSINSADIIGRWENDEFIFVFTGMGNEELYTICEKIRILAEGSTLRNVQFKDIDFFVSVGGTLVKNGDTSAKMIARVLGRLKTAKSKGGNNCVVK